MLNLTRVSGILDTGRMGEALSRPGMDPRVWACLAVVKEVTVDQEEGVFLDVVLMPNEAPETARLAQPYAGPNFGSHYPVQVDDEVLVFAPNGDPDEGLIAFPRLYSKSDPPPQNVIDNPEDVLVVHAKPGQTVRVVTEGGGNIVHEVSGEGLVLLANETVNDFVALAAKVLTELNDIRTKFDAHVHGGVTTGPGTSGVPVTLMGPASSVAAVRTKAE